MYITQFNNSSYCTNNTSIIFKKLCNITSNEFIHTHHLSHSLPVITRANQRKSISIPLHSTSKYKFCTNQKSYLLSHKMEKYILAAQSNYQIIHIGGYFYIHQEYHPIYHCYTKKYRMKIFYLLATQKYSK